MSKRKTPAEAHRYYVKYRDRDLKRHQQITLEKNLRRLYGMTPAQFHAMNRAQHGRCAICKLPPPTGKRLYIDHDHRTGEIRALLCALCNIALGGFGDRPVLALRAYLYLKKHRARIGRIR